MEILNYNDKKYIELTENKLIFYRFWGKRTLKLSKIRCAYMDDNYRVKILYGKKIVEYGIVNVRKEDKPKLKGLIEVLNREEIIVSRIAYLAPWFFICYIPLGLINFSEGGLGGKIFWGIYILICISIILTGIFYQNEYLLYNYNDKYIRIYSFTNKYKQYRLYNDNLKVEYDSINKVYIINKRKYKSGITIPTNIIYPSNYKVELAELLKITSEKYY